MSPVDYHRLVSNIYDDDDDDDDDNDGNDDDDDEEEEEEEDDDDDDDEEDDDDDCYSINDSNGSINIFNTECNEALL